MKRTALLGVLTGSIVLTGCVPPTTQAPAAAAELGRFQIINGTPQFARTTMLLDTVTGESWILCSTPEAGDAWCAMPRMADPTKPKE